ncbi:hypothetical protein BD769DRAFT_1667673 [Suillus cothurnatus]|nr:hypothetical protein BD769DRAFT_1667673 [Suillus cothurnatus]
MTDFLCNTHFNYPEGLRKAIRYHILVNPTGKKGKFQAVDWCIELNNLFTKVINGGKGSNRTVDRIILESPLVQVYRNLHGAFERNFMCIHLTNQHAEADMAQTFKQLCIHIAECSPHEPIQGRNSKYCVPDLFSKGLELMDKKETGVDVEVVEDHATLEDLAVELGV